MNKLIQYKKPELILLAEKVKLRDYPEEKRNSLTMQFIFKLLNLLGVNDGKTEQHNALAVHVSEFYKDYTFEQMDKAFGLFVSGAFNVKPFQQLNAVVYGSVMSEFFNYEKEQTKIYKMKVMEQKETKPPMSEEDKKIFMDNAINKAIEEYQKTGEIELPASKYDWLFSQGIIQQEMSFEDFNELKKAKYETVKAKLLEVYTKQKCISVDEKTENKNIIKELQEKVSGNVVYHCKLEMLKDYFDKQKNYGTAKN